MKRFGVQLTAGLVTIMLGALAAAQARKSDSDTSGPVWDSPQMPAPTEPVRPIEMSESFSGDESFADSGFGDATFAPDQPGNPSADALLVRSSPQTQFKPANETFAVPGEDGGSAYGAPSYDPSGFGAGGFTSNPEPIETIQLAQHTEPAAAAGAADPSTGMTFSPQSGSATGGVESPAMPAMSMPASGPAPLVQEPSGSAMAFPGGNAGPGNAGQAFSPSDVSSAEFSPAPAVGNVLRTPAAGPAEANPLPSISGQGPPTQNFAGVNGPGPQGRSELAFPDDARGGADYPSPVQAAGNRPADFGRGHSGGGAAAFAETRRRGPESGASALSDLPQLPAAAGVGSPSRFGGGDSETLQRRPGRGNSAIADTRRGNERLGSERRFQGNNAIPASTRGIAASSRSGGAFPGRNAPVQAMETIASPGDRRYEGAQAPSVLIHKRAPSEVKVGRPATFVIQVKNVGTVEAMDVQVHDRIPAGMRLDDVSPEPLMDQGQLLWQLGALPPGQERTITLQLTPQEEGELGSVARVTFEAAASVRTMSTRPQLTIRQTAVSEVLIGQQLEIELEMANPGTGEATNVIVEVDVPPGLEHPKGRELDNPIGSLGPGQTLRDVLRLKAIAPGVIQNTVRMVGDDGLETEHTIAVKVVAPELQVSVSGPGLRFLERKAAFQVRVANSGTANATDVEVKTVLDRGLSFVSAGNQGVYDQAQHAVYWEIEQLAPQQQVAIPLELLPIEEGEQSIRTEVMADLGVSAKSEGRVAVESLGELTFTIADSADPIEIGAESTYEIRVANTGSRDDSNVEIALEFPPGIEAVESGDGARVDQQGRLIFPARSSLRAGEDYAVRVRARGVQEGRHKIRAVVVSDQSSVPVTKEESTMVYADR